MPFLLPWHQAVQAVAWKVMKGEYRHETDGLVLGDWVRGGVQICTALAELLNGNILWHVTVNCFGGFSCIKLG